MHLLHLVQLSQSSLIRPIPAQNPQFFLTTAPEIEQSFLSDVTKYTLKAGAASLTLNLFLISSKPKFIIQNVSLILFLCKLTITNEPGSQLMTLSPKYSRSALVCDDFQG